MQITPWQTPYKYGKPLLAGSGRAGAFDQMAVDCPFVFRHRDRFYLMYVGFDGVGYQTALAVSDNLLDWSPVGMILQRGEGRWDSKSIAGTWMLRDNELDGPGTLKQWDGKYWLAYHAYPEEGFEVGPGSIGLAWTTDENLLQWHRLDAPVLTPDEGKEWEAGGLYKECLLEHEGKLYLFYNAKTLPSDRVDIGPHRWKEQIGLAVSSDMRNWRRHEANPVLQVSPGRWDEAFVSEPCVLRYREQWGLYYFGLDQRHAQEGLALSPDLQHWTKHPDPIVPAGEPGSLDATHAHKPSVIMHDGVLYHFYVACRPCREGDATRIFGNEFRCIAVATSLPL